MFGNDEANVCPLLKKRCIEGRCKFWTHIIGQNPQTGAQIDKFDCTFALLPLLLVENSKLQRETGAAVESFRNEMVRQNQVLLASSALAASHEAPPRRLP